MPPLRLFLISLAAGILALSGGGIAARHTPALAQSNTQDTAQDNTQSGAQNNSQTAAQNESQRNASVEFTADSVTINSTTGMLVATGNVTITQSTARLTANRVSYNRNTGHAVATGNVVFTAQSGAVHRAETLTLEKEFSRSIAENVISRLADGSWISAGRIDYDENTGGDFTTSRFTPCNCDFTGGETPLWELRSSKSRHDAATRTIYHSNVRMRLFSVPVMYFPYLWHPDWTVRRQSGLLPPRFALSSDLGGTFEQPFYWVTGETDDLEVTPKYFTNDGDALELNYRRLWNNSEITARLIGGRLNTFRKNREDVIGSDILFSTRFGDAWTGEARLYRTSQDTFMRRYGFDATEELKSHITAERVGRHDYTLVESYSMQDLKTDSDPEREPRILPHIVHERRLPAPRKDMILRLKLGATALNNDDYTDLRRITSEVYGAEEFTTTLGVVTAEARASGQYRNILKAPGNTGYTGELGQGSMSLGIGWARPLVREIARRHVVLEPKAKMISVRATDRVDKVPNRDSADFRLDEANLFLLHREQGEDYTLTHSRVDGGLSASLYDPYLGDLTGFIGSSLRISGEPARGLNAVADRDRRSDILANFTLQPRDSIALSWAGRFQPREFKLNESQARAVLDFGTMQFDITHNQIAASFFTGADEEKEDLIFNATMKLNRDWSASLKQEYDLASRRQVLENSSIAMKYTGGIQDCLNIEFGYRRDGTFDRDIRPIDEVFVVFSFKYLGSVSSTDTRERKR